MSEMSRRWGARTAASVLVVTSTVTAAAVTPAAAATPFTFVDGVLTITTDQATIGCAQPILGGSRKVIVGSSTDIPCVDVIEVVIQGSDANSSIHFMDQRSEIALDPSTAPSLTSITTDLGGGNNSYTGSMDIADAVTSGPGADRVNLQGGDSFDLGAGDDILLTRTYWTPAVGDLGPGVDTLSVNTGNEQVLYPYPGGYRAGSADGTYFTAADGVERVQAMFPIRPWVDITPSLTNDLHYVPLDGELVTYFDTRGRPLEYSWHYFDEPGGRRGVRSLLTLPPFQTTVIDWHPEYNDLFVYNGRYNSLIPSLYQQFLGRDADDGGFDFWYDQLWDGLSHATMVESMLRLPEHATLTVSNEYQHILGRGADAGGLSYWASFLGAGGSPDNLRSLLYGSAEYHGNAGGTTNGFLDALYQDVLGRAPDPGGRDYWSNLIDSGRLNRTDMARVVLSMDEPIDVALTRLYNDLLDRGPSAGEVDFWRRAWRQIGEFGVIASIAGGGEYYEHVAPLDPAHPHYFTDDAQATAAAAEELVHAAAEPVASGG